MRSKHFFRDYGVTTLVISKFEVAGMSAAALDVMKTAVLYAAENRRVRTHKMSIVAFCQRGGFQSTPVEQFWSLLREACRAVVIVEGVDTSELGRDDLPYSSWPVFDGVWIDGNDVMFEICNRSFDSGVLASLPNLRPITSQGRRKVRLVGHRLRKNSSTVDYWKPIIG